MLMLPLCITVFASSTPVEASFLSSLFGNDATASTPETISGGASADNSQNMSLLQANVTSASVLDKKKDEKDADSEVKQDASVTITDNALTPVTNPLGVSDGSDSKDPSFDQISIYVVRPGDSIAKIAEMYDVSVNTIMWANDMDSKKLTVGDTLIILPVSGLQYKVKKGDTLKSIAKEYKADINEIVDYNELELDSRLSVGEEIIIPGAEVEVKVATKPKTTSSSSSKVTKNSSFVNTSGYFSNPLPDGHYVRGLSNSHHGVDWGAPTGTPIYAAASGRVIFAKTGWNGKYGNLVIISHDNGTQTLYAHMSRIGTTMGSNVNKGQVIGYVGSTGRSTGPHLHFEVKGGKNPFSR